MKKRHSQFFRHIFIGQKLENLTIIEYKGERRKKQRRIDTDIKLYWPKVWARQSKLIWLEILRVSPNVETWSTKHFGMSVNEWMNLVTINISQSLKLASREVLELTVKGWVFLVYSESVPIEITLSLHFLSLQEGTVVEPVHVTGAALTFIAGVLYCFLQTVLSYHMCPDYNGLCICRVRLSISFIALASLIISILMNQEDKNVM